VVWIHRFYKPHLVEIAIVVVRNNLFVNITALSRDVQVFIGIANAFNENMRALWNNNKFLLLGSFVRLEDNVVKPRFRLTPRYSHDFTIHFADYPHWLAHILQFIILLRFVRRKEDN